MIVIVVSREFLAPLDLNILQKTQKKVLINLSVKKLIFTFDFGKCKLNTAKE